MLNYNGSSVEQYITLALISNELIVRNVITANTTGIRKALGITTLIMPQLECCHPGLCFQSIAAAVRSAFSHVVERQMLRISGRKYKQKAYNFVQRNTAAGQKGNTVALTDIPNLPGCVVLPTNILETRGNGKEIEVQNFIWKNCRARYEPIQVVSDTMLTDLKCVLVYNMGQHKHCCSERSSPKVILTQRKTKDTNLVQESLQLKQRNLKQEKGRQWCDFLV